MAALSLAETSHKEYVMVCFVPKPKKKGVPMPALAHTTAISLSIILVTAFAMREVVRQHKLFAKEAAVAGVIIVGAVLCFFL